MVSENSSGESGGENRRRVQDYGPARRVKPVIVFQQRKLILIWSGAMTGCVDMDGMEFVCRHSQCTCYAS